MNSEPLLSPDLWERIPSEAQAYIRALEARVAALAAMVQPLRERGNSPRAPCRVRRRATRHQRWPSGHGARPAGVGLGGSRARGHARGLVPGDATRGTWVVPSSPERCRRCQQPRQGEGL